MIDFNNALPQDELPSAYALPRSGEAGPPRQAGRISAEDIRSRLNQDARGFVLWLYSGRAFLYRTEARIGNLLGEAGTSLCIELCGNRAGSWYDHATDQGGDLIALYRGLMGYAGTSHFDRSLKEIASEFLGDSVELEQPSWRVRTAMPAEKIAANKIRWGDRPREEEEVLGAPVATYRYLDVDGRVIAGVTRYEPKTFRPWCFKEVDGIKKWMIGSPQVRPLYHLPELVTADSVVLVEGEGKADALAAFGVVTTSIMGGASAVEKTNWLPLAMKKICIWPDNDEAGQGFAKAATAKLISIGCKVWLVPVAADRPLKWDCGNCIADGEDPVAMLAQAVEVTADPGQLILTAGEFVAGFVAPEYLIDGVVQQGYLWSLTARTSHGKTAVVLHAGQAIARGVPFHGRETRQGSVLFLAGENPQDVRARYLVLADHEKFDPERVPFYFIDGVIDIAASLGRIRSEAASIPNLVLVIVDTAAAYFPGDEDNSNAQKLAFARLLRELIRLPGRPAVIVTCHPVKNASRDNLLPMGGSAFLNEVDGNLTLWAEGGEKQTVLDWQGKFRGPEFESMAFELRTVSCERVKDACGRRMPSVVAVPVTDAGAERKAQIMEDDEDAVLRLLHADRRASFASIAKGCGFLLSNGDPAKAKVQRIMGRLKDAKLVYKFRGTRYRLTRKGCKAVGLRFGKDAENDAEEGDE